MEKSTKIISKLFIVLLLCLTSLYITEAQINIEERDVSLEVPVTPYMSCGTHISKRKAKKILKERRKRKNTLKSSVSTAIPIQIHDVRMSNGSGALSQYDIDAIIPTLNNYFADTNISFFECGAPNIINNSTFYDFNQSQENALVNVAYTTDVVNIYITNSLTTSNGNSAGGYAYYPGTSSYDFIFVIKSQATDGHSTPAHEIGHYLNLIHTHGPVNDILTNELVNGTNCLFAGDGFCDTPADPQLLQQFYLVNTNCQYTGNQVDANGQPFNPLTDNVMSYSRSNCRQFFTPDQIQEMENIASGPLRANLNCTTPPPSVTNDECSNAVALDVLSTCSYDYFDMASATQSYPPSTCDTYISTIVQDVFFSFTAPSDGEVDIYVEPSWGYDPAVFVMETCSPSSLIDCTDNGGGQGFYEDLNLTGLTPGQTYYIRVYDFSSDYTPPLTTTFGICVVGESSPPSGCDTPDNLQLEFQSYNSNGSVSMEATCNPVSGADDYRFTWYVDGVYDDDDLSSDEDDSESLPCGGEISVTVSVICDGVESAPSAPVSLFVPCQEIPCENTDLDITIVQQSPEQCGQSNGMLEVSGEGGAPPYNYMWNDNFQDAIRTGLSAGTYSCEVTDADGCTASVSIIIGNTGSAPQLTSSVQPTTCDESNGQATITAQGNAPFNYLWNDNNNQTTATATGLSEGTYTVVVTDADGCESVENIPISNIGSAPAITSSSLPATCQAGDGEATVLAQGNSPFTYLWNDADAQTTATAINLYSGTYEVVITDSNGCASTETVVVITENNLELTVSSTVAACGASTGTATISATGFSGTVNYLWSNGQTGNSISLPPGNYTVTASDANSCEATASLEIESTPPVNVEAVASDISCYGENDGLASITTSGNYSYLWNTGQTTQTIENLAAGTYTVTVTEGNCSDVENVEIMEPSPLVVSVDSEENLCSLNGSSAEVSISGGIGGYSYSWSNGATTSVINDLSNGNYTVTVTDQNNCTDIASININSPANPPVLYQEKQDISCYGESDGSINLIVQGGVPPLTYSWDNGSINEDISGLPVGYYTALVTDAYGCIAVITVSVNEPNPMSLIISSTPSAGNNGSISLNVNGGTPPFTYQWSNGQTTQIITDLSPGTYSVTTIDANGCTVVEQIEVESITNNEELPEANFMLYPNPNNGVFNIAFGMDGSYSFQVLDVLGREVTTTKQVDVLAGEGRSFSMEHLAQGTYLVRLTHINNHFSKIFKIVITR